MLIALTLLLQARAVARPSTCALHMTGGYAQRFRLWHADGAPLALLVFRFDHTRHHAVPDSLTVEFRQWDAQQRRSDSTWTIPVQRAPLPARTWKVTGTAAAPVAPDWAWWSVVAGAGAGMVSGCQGAIDDGNLSMSDLVIGSASSVSWPHDSTTTLVDARNQFDRSSPLHLYYQVRSNQAHGNVRTTLTLTNVSDPEHGAHVLQVEFSDRLAGGINGFDRIIDASTMARGRYLLELQVADLDGGGASVRHLSFRLR